jgi:aryl-alcohol dehydrogenase-like predicted oxidoreductase
MEYRFLGRSGLKVSAISLGGWYVLSISPPINPAPRLHTHTTNSRSRLTYGGHVDEEKTYACLSAAYNHGIKYSLSPPPISPR